MVSVVYHITLYLCAAPQAQMRLIFSSCQLLHDVSIEWIFVMSS